MVAASSVEVGHRRFPADDAKTLASVHINVHSRWSPKHACQGATGLPAEKKHQRVMAEQLRSRRAEIDQANARALRWLAGWGSGWLTPEQRVRLVRATADAFARPPPSLRALQGAPTPEGGLLAHAAYRALGDDPLVLLAHSCATLQSALSQQWYDDLVERLLRLPGVAAKMQDTALDRHAVMAEAVVVASWVVGLSALQAALGEPPLDASRMQPDTTGAEVPALPVARFASATATRASRGYAPFITTINASMEHDPLWTQMVVAGDIVPFAHVLLAPADAVAWTHWCDVTYIPDGDVLQFFKPAPPSRFLTRPQLESVAAGLTGALQCAY